MTWYNPLTWFQTETQGLEEVKEVPSFVNPDNVELPTASATPRTEDFIGLGFVRDTNPYSKFFRTIKDAAIFEAYFSKAVQNINLSNTKVKIVFNQRQRGVAQREEAIRAAWDKCFLGGESALRVAMFRELAIYGALAFEIVAQRGLTGVDRIVHVPHKDVVFRGTGGLWEPRLNSSAGAIRFRRGFKYIPLQRFMESPYGVPPFIASLKHRETKNVLDDNYNEFAHKLGQFGFLEALIAPPAPTPDCNPQEHPNEYKMKAAQYIQDVYEQLKGQMNSGMAIGFKDRHEFNVSGKVDAKNAEIMVDILDRQLFAGLGQDGNLMGRNYTTTETFVKIILRSFIEQLDLYQEAVSNALAQIAASELRLKGLNTLPFEVIFDKVVIEDEKEAQETLKIKIENNRMLLEDGVITKEEYDRRLGGVHEASYKIENKTMPSPITSFEHKLGSVDMESFDESKAPMYERSVRRLMIRARSYSRRKMRSALKKYLGDNLSFDQIKAVATTALMKGIRKKYVKKIALRVNSYTSKEFRRIKADVSVFDYDGIKTSRRTDGRSFESAFGIAEDYDSIASALSGDFSSGAVITNKDIRKIVNLIDAVVEEKAEPRIHATARKGLVTIKNLAKLSNMIEDEVEVFKRVGASSDCLTCSSMEGRSFRVDKSSEGLKRLYSQNESFTTADDYRDFHELTKSEIYRTGLSVSALCPTCTGTIE